MALRLVLAGETAWTCCPGPVALAPGVHPPLLARRVDPQGAPPLAPTLRELARVDGQRVVVLDGILEVPARLVPPWDQERYQQYLTDARKALDDHHTPLPGGYPVWQQKLAG